MNDKNNMAHHNFTLTADSGSTKTTWRLTRDDGQLEPIFFRTQGISPVHQSAEEIRSVLTGELLPAMEKMTKILNDGETRMPLGGEVQKSLGEPKKLLGDELQARLNGEALTVAFYGAGCLPELCPMVEEQLRRVFPKARAIEVDSDLMGAARALCGSKPGIACILGTGANSGLYDGQRIVAHTPPMGYILGDEGSGASLGKHFLNLLYKGALGELLRRDFEVEMQLSYADVIRRVYREPLAARFLASLSPFIYRHLGDERVHDMVIDCLRGFFCLHVAPYRSITGAELLPVSFVGSIASHYHNQLAEAAEAEGFTLGRVMQEPL